MADDEFVGDVVAGQQNQRLVNFVRSPEFETLLREYQWLWQGDGSSNIGGTSDAPVGTVTAFAGEASPSNQWLICDGSLKSKYEYAPLFKVIGTRYGSSGDLFRVPDLRGRTVIGTGSGSGLSARALNDSGGSENAILVSHNHGGATGSMNRNNPHGHNDHNILRVYGAAGSQQGMLYESRASRDWVHGFIDGHSQTDINHEHGIATEGESGTGKNMPPFVALNYLIKAL